MKYIKKIISIIIMSFLLIVLSFNIFNFVSIKLLKNDLPTINGYAMLEVVSGSMEPIISIGDMVIIDTKVNDYKVKDIVTFKDVNSSFVTHRIIEITDEGFLTKGDANNKEDGIIPKDKIVGKYIFKIDNVGAIMKSMRSPFNLFLILITGILMCILVSTDAKGNPILDEEQKEYFEFLEYKNKKEKNIKDNDEVNIKDKNKDKNKNKNKKKSKEEIKTKIEKKNNDKSKTEITKKTEDKKSSNNKEDNIKKSDNKKVKETTKKNTTSKSSTKTIKRTSSKDKVEKDNDKKKLTK